MEAVEYLDRLTAQQRKRQRKYLASKINQGYVELRVWLLCDKSIMYALKEVMKRLSEDEMKQIINQYIE